MKKDNFIGYDFQGWPLYKMALRDILKQIVKPVGGKFIINEDDKRLDICPRVLEDDGMGYGCNLKYVIEANFASNNEYFNIFVDIPLKKCELWAKTKFMPNMEVKKINEEPIEDERYEIKDIREEDGNILFDVYHYDPVKQNGEILKLAEKEIKFLYAT